MPKRRWEDIGPVLPLGKTRSATKKTRRAPQEPETLVRIPDEKQEASRQAYVFPFCK